jgi:PRTRC genetic system ThiF family protein
MERKMEHFINPDLLQRKARIVVIGAGGTGSHVINGLVQLHTALLALGHPGGLHVTAFDDDTVSESNVGRQAFVLSDIGANKASVLINRLNQAFGLDWDAYPDRLEICEKGRLRMRPDLVIGCVDNRLARKAIAKTFDYGYWMDIGNNQNDGQVILGEFGERPYVTFRGTTRLRLPTVADLLPEAVDDKLDATDDQPSCSLAEALEKQSLFINRAMALHGLNLLWKLFRTARLEAHGVFVNLATDRTSPLLIGPDTWGRFGYQVKEAA